MRIICPMCELFLVDLIQNGGYMVFWCERCELESSRKAMRMSDYLTNIEGIETNT